MPIPEYNGDTFVAFTDISGFKELKKDNQRAVRALDRFYQAGYDVLRSRPSVNGLFVSDCGVLFVRDTQPPSRDIQLQALLDAVKHLNRRLRNDDVMLTTSIAFGQFSYHERLEFPGIEKNPVYGNAYVSCLLDNEAGKPRIQPGQCRIVKRGLPPSCGIGNTDRLIEDDTHWYFYWMVDSPDVIEDFDRQYKDATCSNSAKSLRH